ncbi:MAG TPA: helix-turn-helix domain-containing protein [Chloroflexia bacterium]|nr:helix-turn-helix domain-containing protein [Chloroflexia bacterium]
MAVTAQDQYVKRRLVLDGDIESQEFLSVLKALDNVNRLRILRFLWNRVASVTDIATALGVPASTVALHVETLEEAGLIRTELEAASRGLQKVCIRMFDKVEVELPIYDLPREQVMETVIPIGTFTTFEVSRTCGIASENGLIGLQDDPATFYEPGRVEAQLIWFRHGYLEYRIPNRLPSHSEPETLALSMEVCSEAPNYNLDWPSDITVWINNIEVGTWTCPSDFGGEQGRLTPEWWPLRYTQYGLLRTWQINERESTVDGERVSGVTISDLNLNQSNYISIKIGVKDDARHVGGMNLFGRRFGNHPQDINLWISYRQASPSPSGEGNSSLSTS